MTVCVLGGIVRDDSSRQAGLEEAGWNPSDRRPAAQTPHCLGLRWPPERPRGTEVGSKEFAACPGPAEHLVS